MVEEQATVREQMALSIISNMVMGSMLAEQPETPTEDMIKQLGDSNLMVTKALEIVDTLRLTARGKSESRPQHAETKKTVAETTAETKPVEDAKTQLINKCIAFANGLPEAFVGGEQQFRLWVKARTGKAIEELGEQAINSIHGMLSNPLVSKANVNTEDDMKQHNKLWDDKRKSALAASLKEWKEINGIE